eukprot:3775906-Rhodomonas_salina.1
MSMVKSRLCRDQLLTLHQLTDASVFCCGQTDGSTITSLVVPGIPNSVYPALTQSEDARTRLVSVIPTHHDSDRFVARFPGLFHWHSGSARSLTASR